MSIILIIPIVILFIRIKELTARINLLENKNKLPAAEHVSIQEKANEKLQVVQATTESFESDDSASQVDKESHSFDTSTVVKSVNKDAVEEKEPAFITWLKEDWLLKLGGTLVITGVLFFLSLAYTNVGPQGKVAIGYMFGVTLMIFGFMYAKKQLIGGSIIHLIGATVIIITSYVAHQPGFDVFNVYFAMALMFLTTVCIALMAYAYKRVELAQTALILAGIVPIISSTKESDFFSLLMYLFIVIVGVLWLAFVTEWRSLLLTSVSILIWYSIAYVYAHQRIGAYSFTDMPAQEIVMIIVFGLIFYVTSLFSILRSKGETGMKDGCVALLNAMFALVWIIGEGQKELAPMFIALVGLLYAAGFFFVYKITNVYTSFIIYGGVAIGMLTTAVMLQVEGRAEAVALILIGGGVSALTYYLSRDEIVTKLLSLFNLLPLLYVFKAISGITTAILDPSLNPDVWKDLLVVLLAIVVYMALYAYFSSRLRDLSIVMLGASILLIVIEVWQVLHLLIDGTFASQLSFLIIGVGLTFFSHFFIKDEKVTTTVSIVNLITVAYTFSSVFAISQYILHPSGTDVWKHWVSIGLVIASGLFFRYFFYAKIQALSRAGLTVALLFIVIALWQFFHLVIGGSLATFICLIIYTVTGLITLFQGAQQKNYLQIKISKLWLGLIALRVLFVDAWQLGDRTIGILICIVIGVLLISTTFLLKKVSKE